ncbi:MAG TPA: T9SS type A sorting domain-containing protein, partial [Puia sp.]|nr:T9SS type A sorting domain-containing protein [Puia sp.]
FCLTIIGTGGSAVSGKLLSGMSNALSTDVSVTEYPNPVQDNTIHLRLSNYPGNQVLTILTDMTGREIRREVIHTAPGVEVYTLTTRRKPAKGQYILTVIGKDLKKSIKIIVQ